MTTEQYIRAEIRALDRYTAAVAVTNAIAWGDPREPAAIFNEAASRDAWLRARKARQDAERMNTAADDLAREMGVQDDG